MWQFGSFAIGATLGLFFGRLLSAIVERWEGAETASKVSQGVVTFVLGGGALGGAFLFRFVSDAQHGAYYLMGVAAGGIFAYFLPMLPPRHTLVGIKQVLTLDEFSREKVPDLGERAILILSILEKPQAVQRTANVSEEQLATQLGKATDALVGRSESEGHVGG